MKIVVTLMLDSKNIDLVKDVGQIPYNLYKNGFCRSYLISTNIDMNGNYVDRAEGLNIRNIPVCLKNRTLTGILYLIKNSRSIDVLNLYHCRRRTYIFSKLYKLLNGKGKVYLKLDADFITVEYVKNNKKYGKLFRRLTRVADVVSAESSIIAELLQDYSEKKINVIPNGTDINSPDNFEQKKNYFLTVARLGSYQKNDEFLLQAFAKIADKCDWNLIMVGSIEEEFSIYLEQFFKAYPILKERVTITGEVNDRNKLIQYYSVSKVFVLPSRYESYGIVCAEALKMGCFLVISDQVPPQKEFTANGKYGHVSGIDDVDEFSEAMYKATQTEFDEELYKNISRYASDNFTWSKICNDLNSLLNSRKEE